MDRKDLSSTEIYIYDHNDGSEWSYAASLPSGRNKPAAVTLDNSVLLFGEFIFWINYSIASIILPPIFNPSYLALNLTESYIQYHFLILLAISFPMIPDFT